MKRSGDLEYAYARISSRFGERPNEAAWRGIAIVRGLPAFLDAARSPPFRRWISGIAADAGPHSIEALLVGHWRALVDELCEWMPDPWHAALSWAGTFVDLPVAEYLARGGAVLPWMQDVPRYRELGENGGAPPDHGPLAPLAIAWTHPEGLFRAWCGELSQRVPRSAREAGSPIADCAHLLLAHRSALADPTIKDGILLRRVLVSRLSALYRRATLDPAAAFIFLALSALDMERLRGELLRRAIFPRLGLAA
jgi:hypothetical protein